MPWAAGGMDHQERSDIIWVLGFDDSATGDKRHISHELPQERKDNNRAPFKKFPRTERTSLQWHSMASACALTFNDAFGVPPAVPRHIPFDPVSCSQARRPRPGLSGTSRKGPGPYEGVSGAPLHRRLT